MQWQSNICPGVLPPTHRSRLPQEKIDSQAQNTPPASAAPPTCSQQHTTRTYPHLLRDPRDRSMSRDDTANDLHDMSLTAHADADADADANPDAHAHAANDQAIMSEEFKENQQPAVNAVSKEARYGSQSRLRSMVKRPLSRFPSRSSASSSVVEPLDHYSSAVKSTPSTRRFSAKKVNEWRDNLHNMHRSSRARRSSTPHTIEYPDTVDPMNLTLSRQPTSPSKRSARQGDERPRKCGRASHFPTASDRKDTPAPSAAQTGLPMRPATSRTPTVISAPGGDGARKAAALHKNTSNGGPPPAQHWEEEEEEEEEDIHSRRGRLGSLSSAADSGADLSTYRGSEASLRDLDGDITMTAADPVRDFTRLLPNELALQVFESLDAKDLLLAEQVSKHWNKMSKDTQVWRTVFLRKYQRHVMTDPPPIQVGGGGCGLPKHKKQEWRKMYKARLDLDRNWRAGAMDAGKAVYLSGHTDSVYCLQFDENKIITGSRDRTLRVWDINTFQCIRVIGAPQHKPILGPKVLRTVDYPSFHMATASVNGTAYGDSIYHVPREWHDASILCLQYDDKILVTGSSDSDLLIWDIETYEPIKRLKKHTGGVLDVALDAKHIVSCSKDSRIIVWDRETLEPKGDLTGHRGPVNAVQLRGHLLVSASGDGIARLWDLNQMKLIKEFSAKERGLAAVEFSEDMKYVLAGGNDNITYKFETETGREVMQFTGHSQLVRSLWLDSANNRVVSGSYDLDLRVYDFVTGQELWRGEEWTTSWMLAAKSDYRRIVATSQDGRILIVDFGINKGPPAYRSRDGQLVENVELLRGIEDDNTIKFKNPWNPGAPLHGV
ncbi:F-box WD repeat-containing 1A [Lecanosticta acicola]|uniref:F-box WD repeat-containing 1A n=1 Tax=Lecanosticta acicola TaxID=111012 RepID=A0AAI8Z309_9PEZI|nr:F-box WD repeat-containing 1A [Lecanosticta acicola]